MRPFLLLIAATFGVTACTVHQTYYVSEDSSGDTDGGAGLGAEGEAGTTTCPTVSDPKSCGTCGHDCLGGACASGTCQPVLLVSGEAVSSLVVGESEAYWVNDKNEIRSVPLAGGAPTTIASGWSGFGFRPTSAQDDTNAYFAVLPATATASNVVSSIVRVAKASHAVSVLGSTQSELPLSGALDFGAYSVLVDAGTVYWIAQGPHAIDPVRHVARDVSHSLVTA